MSVYYGRKFEDITPIKDVWKWLNGPRLAELLKVPVDLKVFVGMHSELHTSMCTFSFIELRLLEKYSSYFGGTFFIENTLYVN